MKKNLPSMLLLLFLLILWQAGAMGMDAAYILPSPVQILQRLWELREPLIFVHLPATMTITLIGLLISVILGLLLAVIMDLSEIARQALYPIIIASQTIPTTAIAPLFVLWFGYGIWSKILVTILITFFPITITVYDGFKSTKREMEELLLSFGASKKDMIEIFTPNNSDVEYVVEYVDQMEKKASVYDSGMLENNDKYAVFFGGNYPMIKIKTTNREGRNLLVVKDSYANCFVPFLIPHYKEITMIDPRYYYEDANKEIADSGIQDVLFLYNANTFFEDNSLSSIFETYENESGESGT